MKYTGSAFAGWLLLTYVVSNVPGLRFLARMAFLFGATTTYFFSIPLLVCGLALLVSILTSAKNTALLLGDLAAGRAASKDGKLTISYQEEADLTLSKLWGGNEKQKKCWYVIGGEYYTVDEEAYPLRPDGRFRLFYAPHSKMLLSLEPLK